MVRTSLAAGLVALGLLSAAPLVAADTQPPASPRGAGRPPVDTQPPATSRGIGRPPAESHGPATPGGMVRQPLPPAASVARGPQLFERCNREAVSRRYRGAERRHFVRRCQLGYGRRLFRRRQQSAGPT